MTGWRGPWATAALLALMTALGCHGGPAPPATPASAAPPAGAATGTTPASPAASPLTEASARGVPVSCQGDQPPLVTDLEVRQPPDLPEPPARVPFRDPEFGTCVVRLTDRATDLAAGDSSSGLKNEYSRVQSFNADGTRILVRGIEATWYLYDAQSLAPLGALPFDGQVDPRWDARDPHLLYFAEETRLMAYRLGAEEPTLVHDFAGDFSGQSLAAVWTRSEGSPSLDGRYWGLMAQDEDWEAVALLVYDQEADRVIAKRDIRGSPELDCVTITPLGTYLLAYFDYCESGLGSDDRPCGLMVYDRDLAHGRGLVRAIGHSDPVLDAQGREVLVYQDIDTDHIAALDLASGQVTGLWPIDFRYTSIGLHFSGRAFRRPGWVLVSTYDGDTASHTWMDDQVFAVELREGGRVVRLAHTHSLVDESQDHDYWAEPHASVNPDFSRILFTSNWGRSGTGEAETYLVELPADWTASLPAE